MFTSVSLLIGIILILGALALFFMDRLRPAYARESDKVYAILIFVAGIMTVPDVDMGLGHAFTLMLLSGVATSVVIDNLRLRGPNDGKIPQKDNRPPRPRYDERPPVQRGYRAELDDRGYDNRGPAFREARPPRMNPARATAWREDFRDDYRQQPYDNRPRQPYEEYRGPAGRLQPSPERTAPPANGGRPPEGFRTEGFRDEPMAPNVSYGDRPPAGRPPENGGPGPGDFQGRPPAAPRSDGPANGPGNMPLEERTGARPPRPEDLSAERPPAEPTRDDAESPARPLNIRPYSEASRLDEGRSS